MTNEYDDTTLARLLYEDLRAVIDQRTTHERRPPWEELSSEMRLMWLLSMITTRKYYHQQFLHGGKNT